MIFILSNNKKKIFSVIGMVVLIIGVFCGCHSKSSSDFNYNDQQIQETESNLTQNEKFGSRIQDYEIIDMTAPCYYGDDKYNKQKSEITIKAPKLEGLDYSSAELNLYAYDDGYCKVVDYNNRKKSEASSDFETIYKGTEEDVLSGNGKVVGFTLYQEGKYQLVDGEAVDNDDLYSLIDANGKVIIYWTENSNCDTKYYDRNGSLIYQLLFLNDSDHATCFDSNGYEISVKELYNSIINDFQNEEFVVYYFTDILSRMN